MLAEPDIAIDVPSAGLDDDQCSKLHRSHGVLCMFHADACIALVASADVRGHVLDRVGPDASQEHDLRGGCDLVRCWNAGSSFEADLLFLDVAAALAPELARQAAARLTVWWIAVDQRSPGGGWTITDEPITGEGVSVVGPFLDRTSARRWADMLDDLFELCRYAAELRKAPAGTACAYHEMGRCPAPCDGSEPMAAYGERLREAVMLDSARLAAIKRELEQQMKEAAASADFERAAAMRDRLSSLPDADDRAAAAVGPMDNLDCVAVVPPRRGTRVGLLRVARTAWCRLGELDVSESDSMDAVREMLARPMPDGQSPAIAGVLAREIIRPRRGGPTLVRKVGEQSLDAAQAEDAWAERVWASARSLAATKPTARTGTHDAQP
ncbi:MAG: UvrB/UvrC motif-containing protein [Planctomycetota bacterium]